MIEYWHQSSRERKVTLVLVAVFLSYIVGALVSGQSDIVNGLRSDSYDIRFWEELWLTLAGLVLFWFGRYIFTHEWTTGIVERLAIPPWFWPLFVSTWLVSVVIQRWETISTLLSVTPMIAVAIWPLYLFASDRRAGRHWSFPEWAQSPIGLGFRRFHVYAAVIVLTALDIADLLYESVSMAYAPILFLFIVYFAVKRRRHRRSGASTA